MKMEYVRFGDGLKQMVILPGISLKPVTAASQAIMDAYDIFAKDFTVYLFDYADDPKEDLKIEDMADDVAEALKELELKDVYLYGVSMGGMVAQCLCIRYPGLVRKLALTSTVSRVASNDKTSSWLKCAMDTDILGLVSNFMKDVYTDELYEQLIDATLPMYKDLSDEELRAFTIRLKAAEQFDVSEELYKIDIPVLVLGSKCDRVFDWNQMAQTAQILNCESYFYEGYSHAVYDEADDIKQRILDFYLR